MGAVKALLLDRLEAEVALDAFQAHALGMGPAPRDGRGRVICPDCAEGPIPEEGCRLCGDRGYLPARPAITKNPDEERLPW